MVLVSNTVIMCVILFQGMYFVSCVLLMRMNMPIEYRSVTVLVCTTRPVNVSCYFIYLLANIGSLYLS